MGGIAIGFMIVCLEIANSDNIWGVALFSQRHGFREAKSLIQTESVDDELRHGLWNALTVVYWDRMKGTPYLSHDTAMQTLCQRIWHSYFKWPIDSLDDYWPATYKELRTYFLSCPWEEVYDFIEFVPTYYPDDRGSIAENFQSLCNEILERELAGYRFVSGLVTPITSEEELASINEAQSIQGKWKPVSTHLRRATELFADRKEPDYRNSIKESISAVEAACSILVGKSTSLGAALKQLDTTMTIHPALQQAFQKLYGYTSDADGIRHSMLDESTLGSEDAQFMLVTCSAFINYLRTKCA